VLLSGRTHHRQDSATGIEHIGGIDEPRADHLVGAAFHSEYHASHLTTLHMNRPLGLRSGSSETLGAQKAVPTLSAPAARRR